MPLPRIIPCLDLANGRVVKGVRFQHLRDAGDAVELAKRYEQAGADELVFLDITATIEGRQATRETVHAVASELTIPFTVGGGIRSVEDARLLLKAGCDKISINSAAVMNPELLREASYEFGSQCVVLAIDAMRKDPADSTGAGGFEVVIHSGKTRTGLDPVGWVTQAVALGAGELLVTSVDRDGTKDGFDLPLLRAIRNAVNVPIIASGGAGRLEHFTQVFRECDVDAALAASLFHYAELRIEDVKHDLARNGIPVRGSYAIQ